MFFGKKPRKSSIMCESCGSKISKNYSFCPHCGDTLFDTEEESENFGFLGRDDHQRKIFEDSPIRGLGIMDKMINSMMANLAKSFEKQIGEAKNDSDNTKIETFPNGIKITIGPTSQLNSKSSKKPQENKISRKITDKQLSRMAGLPRVAAKTSVKRLADKLIYELDAPGTKSQEDIFISKLESGYEVKAISEKKIYVNSIPVNLPIKKASLAESKIVLEFASSPN